MRIRPDGVELLRAARVTINTAIAPHLAHDRLTTLVAIERAMALAEDRLARDARASAADLVVLEDARLAMRGDVLEGLPDARRYDARLVAKAISIAMQQLVNGHSPERRECDRLGALLGIPSPARASVHDTRCTLGSLNDRLAARIRAGDADAGTTMHEATLAHLEAITQEALSESNPTYRRRESGAVAARAHSERSGLPRFSPFDATLSAWSDVPRAFMSAFPLIARPAPIARRVEACLHLPGVFGEAVFASGNIALATQADLFGWFAQRLAANPRVPMLAVESAHLTHDLSLAFADASAAFFGFALGPFRRPVPQRSGPARLP